jgi:hypothetical protein
MKKYFVINEDSIPELMTTVEGFMSQGWKCQGGVMYVPLIPEINTETFTRNIISEKFLQAMIKE